MPNIRIIRGKKSVDEEEEEEEEEEERVVGLTAIDTPIVVVDAFLFSRFSSTPLLRGGLSRLADENPDVLDSSLPLSSHKVHFAFRT